MNIEKIEQVLVTNKHPFFREKGQRCPICGSHEEALWVYNGINFLSCQKCNSQKGGDVFRESNLKDQGDHYPWYDHCPYCGHRNKVETFERCCEQCREPDPQGLKCPKCGGGRGTYSIEGKILKIICFDCGTLKKTNQCQIMF